MVTSDADGPRCGRRSDEHDTMQANAQRGAQSINKADMSGNVLFTSARWNRALAGLGDAIHSEQQQPGGPIMRAGIQSLLLGVCLIAPWGTGASAQVSDDMVKIGVLTDMSGPASA